MIATVSTQEELALSNQFLKEFLKLKKETYLDRVFSPSEKQVFQLIEKGMPQSQICFQLGKASSTLKKQINSMLDKTNSRNCIELITKINNQFYQ